MQAALLPSDELLDEIHRRSGLYIDAHFEASSELGGDFWGVRRSAGKRTEIFIADFSGHGVGAADNLIYAAAGQPPPLLGRPGSPGISFPETHGMPLGMKKGVRYENHQEDFPPGSFLFLYSDALIETPLGDGECLDTDAIEALLRESLATADEAGPMAGLARHFHQMRGAPLGDDLTAVLARRDA